MGIIDRVRNSIPNATITTDIIVGFPGESEEDFNQTLSLMEEAKFLAAYSFQYSKRPGTPAATMENQISDDVMADRYERLHKLQQKISATVNEEVVGSTQEILVADLEGENRGTGRTKDFRLTHFAFDPKNPPRLGDAVSTKITGATANFILADELPIELRRTKGGDATEARAKESTSGPLMVGMPTLATLKAKM
jgi:tRNA-2-methylthio-N6-dimethylallyladenosine synthase